ncbi:hypothetical protein [Carnobacterium inhibens]|uniref:hypothetical protein n=1 Tax=Carnobacterium inhibens TaxID=147709 RepID=UPI00203EC8C0|nr:hypothetical protein [Carnobacterium inhibens]MCM3513562.1 hypothetical protein [Carnobacterium inhibens]
MKWVKRIAFTLIYLVVTLYMIWETNIPPVIILSFVVIFSSFISKNGVFAELEQFFKKAR